MSASDRRPLKVRSAGWAGAFAARVSRSGISANAISVMGIVFAALGAWLLWTAPGPWAFALAAVAIQLRLLCNLFDGMVAVEGGKAQPTGVMFNEFPDRLEDVMFLVAAGYACGSERLGWACGVLAVMTAQARSFNAVVEQAQDFGGPMAKPQRMALLTLACLLTAVLFSWEHVAWILRGALWIILIGAALTWGLRLSRMASGLEDQAKQ
ncbi:MAG: CDP-alcohol phosphatidyltransferase family protein [Planctomycetota bacterium]